VDTSYAVVTTIGGDRVGIVDELSAMIEEHQGNITESRMAVLGGEFAVIMLISGKKEDLELIRNNAPAYGKQRDLHISVKLTKAPVRDEEGKPYLIECSSLDTPGIVHTLSSVLHRFNINIQDLEADTLAAPWTGAPMFYLKALLSIPQKVSVTELREEFGKLEETREIDIVLKPWTGGGSLV
jgi:glycine cleavage system transcriptional repressor